MSKHKTTPLLEWFARVSTGVVAVAGIALSAAQLFALGRSAGWSTALAWLLPVLIDGAGLAGGAVWIAAPTDGARRYGMFVLIETVVLSVLGNIAQHWAASHPAQPLDPSILMLVAAVVPVQIPLTVHLVLLLGTTESRATTSSVPTTTQVPAGGTPKPVPAHTGTRVGTPSSASGVGTEVRTAKPAAPGTRTSTPTTAPTRTQRPSATDRPQSTPAQRRATSVPATAPTKAANEAGAGRWDGEHWDSAVALVRRYRREHGRDPKLGEFHTDLRMQRTAASPLRNAVLASLAAEPGTDRDAGTETDNTGTEQAKATGTEGRVIPLRHHDEPGTASAGAADHLTT